MTLAERIAAELSRVSTDRYMFGLFGDGRMGAGGFGKLQILGKTKHVTRCQNCGRAGLKHAVVCAVVGEDGHPTNQYYYFGTDCAARLAGKAEKDVEAEADHQESSGRPRMKSLKPAKPNEGQMELGLRFSAFWQGMSTERYARAKASKGQMGFDFDALASTPQTPAPAVEAKPAVSEPPALPVKGKQMGLFDQPEQPAAPATKPTGWDEEKHPRWEAGDKQHHGGQFSPKESKPHKVGETESAAAVLERVKSSPNQPKERDWGRFAGQFGIEGDFKHVEVPAATLKQMIDGGHLRVSSSIDPDEVSKKARSGQRNPVLISNEPGRSGLVVDGNHSLQAALKAGDETVKAIVPASHPLAAASPKESKSEERGQDEEKPQAAISNPPFRDFRYMPKHRNSGSLYPNRPGQVFTDEQQQQLRNWARQNGMMVGADSGPGAIHVVHNDHRSRLDLTLHGAEGVKREAAEVKSKQAAEQEVARKQQADSAFSGRASAGFINDAFGDSLNTYNKSKLADVLEGKEKKFGGLWGRSHAEPLQKLGALDATGQVNLDAIKRAFEQHGKAADSPAQPQEEPKAAEGHEPYQEDRFPGKWLVPSKAGVQGFGDTIHGTKEEAIAQSHLTARDLKWRQEATAKAEAEERAEADRKAAFKASGMTPTQAALQARVQAHLNQQVSAQGNITTRQALLDKELAEGHKPVVREVPDEAARAKAAKEAEFMLKRGVPTGNESHPDTIKLRQLQAKAKSAMKQEHVMEKDDGVYRTLSKMEHDYAASKYQPKQAEPKAEGKEPWQMTRGDVLAANPHEDSRSYIDNNRVQWKAFEDHKQVVFDALAAGKPVPDEVLADYPELQKPAPTPKPGSFSGVKEAANELQAIRNELAGANPDREALRKRVDAVGDWIGSQKTNQPALQKIAQEAHQISDKLDGGSGKGGNRIAIESPAAQLAESVPSAGGGLPAPETQDQSVGGRVAAAIAKRSMDFGRKVEVRKDRAKSIGPKAKKQVHEWDLDEGWARRYQITQVASSKDPSEVGKFIITDKKQKGPWYAKDQGVQVGGQYASAEEAKQALPLIEVARNHRVYEGRDGKWHIYRKLGERHHVSVKSFPSQEEAMKYMAMNPREIIGHKFPRYETYQYLTEVERTGPERRKGTVNEQDFQKAFAPGGAVFGNWMTNKDGVTAFHHAYDSLHDLADVLDLHPHQVSIDGDLVFGFGAAGSGGKDAARAHYEPGQRLINLTKMAGAGSLAHEWWHALEHHIAKKLGASEHTALNLRPSAMKNDPGLAAAVEELHDAMHYSNDESANKAELQRVAEAQERRKQKLADANRESRENGTTIYDPQSPEDFLHNIRLGMQRTLSYKKKVAKPELMKQYEEIENKLKAGDLGERAGSTTHGFIPIYANIQSLSELHKKITGRGLLAKDSEGDKWLRRIYWDNLKLEKPKPEAQKVESKPKRTLRSKFKIEADKLDNSRTSPYYGLPHEMAARAFESYVEDKLKEKGIRSDYLVGRGKTDSAFYKAFGLDAPFPEGEERKQINAAFDKLLNEVRKHLRKPETERHSLMESAEQLNRRVRQMVVERYGANSLTPEQPESQQPAPAPKIAGQTESHPHWETPEFKNWFGSSHVKTPEGKPLRVFHGTKRPDRIQNFFNPKRATSGPMSFFTDNPEIASSYATGKQDTSLEMPENYSGWFKYKIPGSKREVDLDSAWHHLPVDQRKNALERLPHVNTNEEGVISHQHGQGTVASDWDWYLKREGGGNPLKAARYLWLDSGHLFNDEHRFLEVLKHAGIDHNQFRMESPWHEQPGVYPVHLSIQNPLDTANIPEHVHNALQQAGKRKRGSAGGGVDQWDKRHVSGPDWLQRLAEDRQNGTAHAWTSIPDWVTKTLMSHGYDGIKDSGGKGGGTPHNVWIPFHPHQVKSAIGNRGTYSRDNKRINYSANSEVARYSSDSKPESLEQIQSALEKQYPALKMVASERPSEVHLHQIEVAKESRGQGIGRMVMERLKGYAQKAGKPITLHAEPEKGKKTALNKFYQQAGFSKVGRNRDYRLAAGHTHVWRPEPSNPGTEQHSATAGVERYSAGHGFEELLARAAKYRQKGQGYNRNIHTSASRLDDMLSQGRHKEAAHWADELRLRLDALEPPQPKPATNLFGEPAKPAPKPKAVFDSTKGKQQTLFAGLNAKEGQMNLFADQGVPDELVAKPQAPAQKELFSAIREAIVERYAAQQSPWFLRSSRILAEKMGQHAPASQVLATLRNNQVSPEELKWTGLEKHLLGKGNQPVSQQELNDMIGQFNVGEKVLGDLGYSDKLRKFMAETGWRQDIDGPLYNYIYKMGTEANKANLHDKAEEFLQLGNEAWEKRYAESEPKYASYALPGGQNYREMLLTLPEQEKGISWWYKNVHRPEAVEDMGGDESLVPEHFEGYDASAKEDLLEMYRDWQKKQGTPSRPNYLSRHWDAPNVLAHIRYQDFTGPDGKKHLHIDEIQSDWHQQGRKQGYLPTSEEKDAAAEQIKALRTQQQQHQPGSEQWDAIDEQIIPLGRVAGGGRTNQVPDAPFKNNWHMLAMKRMMHHAAANGYDRVTWTPGEEHASRYDLSKHVGEINYRPGQSSSPITITGIGGHTILDGSVKDGVVHAPSEFGHFHGKHLHEIVGKEVSEKLTSTPPHPETGVLRLSGDGLKVGGEGMKGFYDRMLPNDTNKLIKKHGGKVGQFDLHLPSGIHDTDSLEFSPLKKLKVHGFDVTPSMKAEATGGKGQSMFSVYEDTDWRIERYEQAGDRQPKFRIDAGMKAATQQTPPSTKPPAIIGAIGGMAAKAGNWLQDKADKVAGKIGGAAQKLDRQGQAAMAKVGLAEKPPAAPKTKSSGVKAGAPLMFNGDHAINGGQASIPKGTQGKLVGPHDDPKNVVVDVGGQHHVVPKSLLLHDLRHTDHKAVEKSKQESQQSQADQQAKVRQMTARQRAEAVPDGADKAKLQSLNIGSHELQVGDVVNHGTPGLHPYGRVLEVSPDGKKIKIEEATRSKKSPNGIATTGRHVWIDGHEKIGDTGAVGTRSFPVLRTPDEYRPIGERKEYKEAFEGAKKLGLNDDQSHEMAMQMWDDLQAKNNPQPKLAPAAQQPAQAQAQPAQAKPAGSTKPRHHAESLQAGDTLRMLKGADASTNLKFIGRSKQPGMVEVEHPTLGRQTFRSRDLGLYVPGSGSSKAAGPSFTDQMKKGYDRSSPELHTVKPSEFAGQKHGVLAKDQQGRGFLLYGGRKYALNQNEFDGKKLIGDNPGVKIRERIHREQVQALASEKPAAVPSHVREEYDHHWNKWTGNSPFAKSGGEPAKGPAQVPQAGPVSRPAPSDSRVNPGQRAADPGRLRGQQAAMNKALLEDAAKRQRPYGAAVTRQQFPSQPAPIDEEAAERAAVQAETTEQPAGGPASPPPTQPERAATAPPADNPPAAKPQSPNLRALIRPFHAGQNLASMQFDNEQQRDLYDYAAGLGRARQNPGRASGKQPKKAAELESALNRIAAEHFGGDKDAAHLAAIQTQAHVKAHMKGVPNGQHKVIPPLGVQPEEKRDELPTNPTAGQAVHHVDTMVNRHIREFAARENQMTEKLRNAWKLYREKMGLPADRRFKGSKELQEKMAQGGDFAGSGLKGFDMWADQIFKDFPWAFRDENGERDDSKIFEFIGGPPPQPILASDQSLQDKFWESVHPEYRQQLERMRMREVPLEHIELKDILPDDFRDFEGHRRATDQYGSGALVERFSVFWHQHGGFHGRQASQQRGASITYRG